MSAPHTSPVPPEAAADVRALFEAAVAPAEAERIRQHLRACAACAALYDRVAEAESAVAGRAAADERVLGWLALDGAAPAKAAPRARAWARQPFVTAAIALAVFVTVGIAVRRDGDWGTRGGGNPRAGIRVFALSQTGAHELNDGAIVHRADSLGVAYSNPGNFRYVTWVAIAADGKPAVLDSISSAAKPGALDEPVDGKVELAGRFPDGPLRLYAIFSNEPLDRSALLASPHSPTNVLFPGHETSAELVRLLEIRSGP